MALALIIGIIIVAIIVLMFIFYFNRFVVLGNRIDNSLSQIDVQLKRRADLVPNLIETVKGYAKHEKKIIEDVTKARASMLKASNIEGKVKADNQLEKALKSIFALAEAYPDLKANTNFLQLQQELASIEDKIAYSRQFYNDSILTYNNSVETFPGAFFAKIYSKKEKEHLKIAEAERVLPKVKFE